MLKLILLPGMDGTGELFQPFLEAFPNAYSAQVIHYPTDRALHYEALSNVVRSALPEREDYIILAESFSGPIAIMLAAEARPNLKGLILCCTFARNPRPLLSKAAMLVAGTRIPPAMISFALLGRFGGTSLRNALARAVGQVSPAVIRERMRAAITVDVSSRLAGISVPSLYLRASQDRLVPSSASAHIEALMPNMKIVEIAAPHALLQAAPDDAARAVVAFAREL